jgi:hypothetical protein
MVVVYPIRPLPSRLGAVATKKPGTEQTFSASTQTPLDNRAHIINRDNIAQRLLAAGSLDPNDLIPVGKEHKDAARFLAKLGVEWEIGVGWKFMGQQREGRSVAFHSTGTSDGHGVEIGYYAIKDAEVPVEKLAHGLTPEDVEEQQRLERLAEHKVLKIGDVEGVLHVSWGPNSPDELQALLKEKGKERLDETLWLATDGTGLRSMSWRGAVKRAGDAQLLIVSFTSPIDRFHEARPIFDAMLARARIMA